MQNIKVGDRVRVIETGEEYSVCATYPSRSNLLGYGAIHNTKIELVTPQVLTVYVVCDNHGNPKTGNSLFWDKEPADRLLDMLHSNGFRTAQVLPFTLTPSEKRD